MCMLFGCFIGSVNYMMRSGTWGPYRWRPFAVYGRRCSLYRTGSLRSWIPSSSGTLWTPVTTTTVITTARKSRTLWREWAVAMETAGGWVPCCQLWMKRDRGNWRRLVPVCRIRWVFLCEELFYYSNEILFQNSFVMIFHMFLWLCLLNTLLVKFLCLLFILYLKLLIYKIMIADQNYICTIFYI